ncbi:hypothetical protein ABW21_db0206892 [Orbilia brochopaga]|nr:hypothetical protein ABW21_db0206892 [Drechslerella brochopaga]
MVGEQSGRIQPPSGLAKIGIDLLQGPSKRDSALSGRIQDDIAHQYKIGTDRAIEHGIKLGKFDGATSTITDQQGGIIGLFNTHRQLDKRVFKGVLINGNGKTSAVMKVFLGADAIYWSNIEKNATAIMSGSPCTPKFLAFGLSKGSSNTIGGHVVLKTFCPGERLGDSIWDVWGFESQNLVLEKIQQKPILEAIKQGLDEFRKRGLVIRRIARDDILWDQESRQIYFLDFESCDYWDKNIYPGLTI